MSGVADQIARETITKLGLRSFIKDWNSGVRSLLRVYDHVLAALRSREELNIRYQAAKRQADELGLGSQFEQALARRLKATIDSSFPEGLMIACLIWAEAVARAGAFPGAPNPATDAEGWVEWCFAHLRLPTLESPSGDPVVAPHAKRNTIRRALLAMVPLAVEVQSTPAGMLRH